MAVEIHHEFGPISERNDRLLNHAHLGLIFPWIPELVLPPDEEIQDHPDRFPVEQVPGRKWRSCMADPSFQLADHLQIALATVGQLRQLWQTCGILLIDRHHHNIMVDQQKQVWQVDLGMLYDGSTDRVNYIGREEDLPSRQGNWELQSPPDARRHEVRVCVDILANLEEAAERIRSRQALSAGEVEVSQSIYQYFWGWWRIFRSQRYLESDCVASLAQLEKWLAQLLATIDKRDNG